MPMFKPVFGLTLLLIMAMALILIAGCAVEQVVGEEQPVDDEINETGTLVFTANGEDFIRDGFVCKDGWELTFDHAYVTLTSISAFQTNPPYETEMGWEFENLVQTRVDLTGVHTVDLAAPNADPAIVGEAIVVPAGRYNALSWELVRAPGGPAEGFVVLLLGRAEKDGEMIEFSLGLDREVAYLGGEYIGDERKGILLSGESAEVEMTFHFDHLFGDFDEDPEDELNQEALGFGPLAALAVDGSLEVSLSDLESMLSADEYELLLAVMTHLAHVGEGHCLAVFIQ
jgi:hypothetical protein